VKVVTAEERELDRISERLGGNFILFFLNIFLLIKGLYLGVESAFNNNNVYIALNNRLEGFLLIIIIVLFVVDKGDDFDITGDVDKWTNILVEKVKRKKKIKKKDDGQKSDRGKSLKKKGKSKKKGEEEETESVSSSQKEAGTTERSKDDGVSTGETTGGEKEKV
jgi:hypothetical protein